MVEPLTLKDHSTESQIFFDRVVIGFGLLLVLTGILVGRLFYLQIIQHGVYSTLSDKNRIHIQSLPPTRGLIFDRNGQLIADNVPAKTLTIVKERSGDIDNIIARIQTLVPISQRQIESFKKRMARRYRPFESVPLRFKLSEEEIAIISVNMHNLPGAKALKKLTMTL